MELNYETLAPLVEKVADSVSSSFPGYVQSDDTESAIWVWLYEKRGTVAKLMATEGWEAKLYHTITQVANEHVIKEDGAVNGYSADDTFNYSTDLIKELLTHVFDYEDWQKFGVFGEAGMPRLKSDPSKSGNQLAMFSDIKDALNALGEDQYNVILWTYKYNYNRTQLGEELGISQPAASKRVSGAVRALQRELGKRDLREVRGDQEAAHRRARGNADAQAIVDRDWNG